jgi:hypothetical protein
VVLGSRTGGTPEPMSVETFIGKPWRYCGTNWAVSAPHAGLACGHILPTLPLSIDRSVAGSCGALNRRSPTGGAAYRMLEKL